MNNAGIFLGIGEGTQQYARCRIKHSPLFASLRRLQSVFECSTSKCRSLAGYRKIHRGIFFRFFIAALASENYFFFDFRKGQHWKEALKILKLAVTRSSSLVAPPSSSSGPSSGWGSDSNASSFSDSELFVKKELPGEFVIVFIACLLF